MLSNYFKITIRNLFKNKTFSFINIVGLAVGMASFLLITLWIQHEISFEQFHEKKNDIYQVFTNLEEQGNVVTDNTSPVPLADVLKHDFPEIKNTSRTSWVTNHLLKVGNKEIAFPGLCVEPGFLRMFSFPLVKGNPETAFEDIYSIVITEKLAKALFGDQDPINKTIQLDNQDNFKVSGVLKNLPQNTSFSFDYLLPYSYFRKSMPWAEIWTSSDIHTYVELDPRAKLTLVQQKIEHLPSLHGEKNLALFLHPLTDWWF